MKEINYKYISCPINLMKMMDSNCRNLLVVLLMIEFEERNDTFKVSSKVLQTLTGFCKKVLNATLSALHRNGIITVKCSGMGKGQKQSSNTITINYEKFKEYDEQYITLTKLMDETQHIVTDDYRQTGYKVSYLPTEENTEKEKSNIDNEIKPNIPVPVFNQKEIDVVPPAAPATTAAPAENNDMEQIADEGKAAYPFSETELEKDYNECTDSYCYDKQENNNDIKQKETMKDFTPERIIDYAKENNLSLYSNGIPSPMYYRMQNRKAFEVIENQLGSFEDKQVEELWRYCVVNGVNF